MLVRTYKEHFIKDASEILGLEDALCVHCTHTKNVYTKIK